jgi:putative membrane protein
MPSAASWLRPLIFGLLGVYLFLYPGSIALVALDRVPVWGTWMGGALLIWQGALMGCWLIINYGRWGALATALILFLSWFVEHIGATTGFPFGSYTYTEVLQPQIAGIVPLAIPFAWLLIVTAAVGVSEVVRQRDDRRVSVGQVLMAASFALLLDVTIEPFAVNINRYWVWSADAELNAYYGIPASNFVAWWVTSFLLVLVLLLARSASQRRVHVYPLQFGWLPLGLYLTNLTMFVVVNLARGQGIAALIGALILLFIGANLVLPRLARLLAPPIDEQQSGA